MSDVIKILPESLANQIAAGEVVQRPASVVKELLENAVDAEATEIKLFIKDSGKTTIQVVDNGNGMSFTDARLCFERHATSKLKSTEDLFRIRTMGFRGEAMASIAAVAQVELKTALRSQSIGTYIRIEGSVVKEHNPCAHVGGTTITVNNLFYNVPARRQFLKSDLVEFRHIQEEFNKLALANPEISFSLYNDDEELFVFHPSKMIQRIVNILGPQYKDQLAACKEETQILKVHGYIGKPESARKTRGDQYFYVNKRFIKHPYLHHAVAEAYKGLIDSDQYPSYVLFLEIDPKHVDVNVHPTKTEVKFDDERTMYGILLSAVRKSLSQFELSRSLDFDENVNHPLVTQHDFFAHRKDNRSKSSSFEQQVNFFFGGAAKSSTANEYYSDVQHIDIKESKINQSRQLPLEMANPISDRTFTWQLHQSFLLTQLGNKVLLIDQQSAHERILFELFADRMQAKKATTQQTLFPQRIQLSAADYTLIMQLKNEIEHLGFSFSEFGNQEIVIQGIPAELTHIDVRHVFESFLEQYKRNQVGLNLDIHENIARSFAKKACIKRGQYLSEVEQFTLIEKLFTCQNPSFTPDGIPTVVYLDKEKMHSLFLG